MQPTRKINPMKTWPVTSLPKGRQPPGGRLQRSTRLRKKFYKWWIQKIVPPFNIGKAIDFMVKHTKGCNWDIVDKAMKTMEASYTPQPYTCKLNSLMKESLKQMRVDYRARPSRAKMRRSSR